MRRAFLHLFRREQLQPAIIEGDCFHRYDRSEMQTAAEQAEREGRHLTHFGPEGNFFDELEWLFKRYADTGRGRRRYYVHNEEQAARHHQPPGTFTAWEDFPSDTDLLFYEGLHGALIADSVNVLRYIDLCIGVVPIINLEWIQKIHRDRVVRGYTTASATRMILNRMHDYVYYITPQFSRTDINFQRVPTVDTSNPFIARFIPTADESFVVIRFVNPEGIDFPYLLSMLDRSFMSRANTIVVPGGKMDLAMQLIFTPLIWRLMERRTQALQR